MQDGRGPADEGRALRRTGLLVTFILAALAAVPPLSMDMYLPALPEIAQGLGASATAIQLTLTACLAGMALGQLVVGPMSDRWGRRGPLLVGLLVYIVASAICAFAPTGEVLIAFRLLQGLAGAAGIVIARAVVRDLYDGLEMARFFSSLLLISGCAPIIAPIIGAQVLRFTDWRGIFIALTLIGIALTVLVWRRLPETLAPEKRQNGGVRATLWIMRGLFADRLFTGYMLTNGFTYGALFSYITASPFVIQDIYGASPQTFSLIFGLNSLGLMIVGQINGKVLVGRVSLDKSLGFGLAMMALAAVMLVLVTGGAFGDAATVPIAVGLFVLISALGLVLPNTNALALMRTPHAAGSASALVGISCYVMGAIGSSIVGFAAKDTAVPMAAVQLGSVLAAIVCFTTLCGPWKNRKAAAAKD
ncbi:multidrug effflux MFS transporter (plasmid) [Streptomyces xanthophaeus]|nr:multidrug effflux MFS transporter [Streptomyces xanthophaeus]WST65935.1 multidrug effflux MFS transporter [Streptomyces xanthophaeus]